jgi:hypothetical protein
MWRLVDKDKLQHVGTGLFLDSDVKYAHFTNNEWIWEDNHTFAVLRERTSFGVAESGAAAPESAAVGNGEGEDKASQLGAVERDLDSQRWVFGPEEFHGGAVEV